MTHIDNFPSILDEGGIHSYNQMESRTYTKLSHDGVQQGRAQITVPCIAPRLRYILHSKRRWCHVIGSVMIR